jgi:cell wall-associated NlpC family hydrolase
VQVAIALHFFEAAKGRFYPEAGVTESQADHALVRMICLLHPTADWTILTALQPTTWQPNPGWTTNAPTRLPWEVAARFLGLRYNHLSEPALEVSPSQDIDRAEVAYMFKAALTVAPWQLDELSGFDHIVLPSLSARQRQIIAFALQYAGYPYVWGGQYPAPDSPYGLQAHGGFDCSGFVWWVLKTNFGYAIPNAQRTAAAMAAAAKPRISLSKLAPCDIIFFGPKGPKSSAASIFHTAIYLGNGWFLEASNFFDGVTLANLDWPGWYYSSGFAWGRQVLSPAQLSAVAGT